MVVRAIVPAQKPAPNEVSQFRISPDFFEKFVSWIVNGDFSEKVARVLFGLCGE